MFRIFLVTRRIYYFQLNSILITKRSGRLLIAPDSRIQKISQATVRDEIWFMTRVDVVAADGTVAIYFQQFYKMYG